MSIRRAIGPVFAALILAGCGIAVRSDRASVGGGPEQATAQAAAAVRATAVALATANAGTLAATSAVPCDCETGK